MVMVLCWFSVQNSSTRFNKVFTEYLEPNFSRTTICSRIRSLDLGEIIEIKATNSSKSSSGNNYCSPQNSAEVYQDAYSEDMERINSQLIETEREAKATTNESFAELLNCRRLEIEAMEAIQKVKLFESSHAHEVELLKEVEDALRVIVTEQQRLLEESENISRELQMTMRNMARLDSRAKEATRRRDEAAHRLFLIQTSISTLSQERQQIRRQKMEALCGL